MKLCQDIEDHEWVDNEDGDIRCQACGVALEDAPEAHAMEDADWWDNDDIEGS